MIKAISKMLDIKPFNQFFFIDCFYNALFAVLGYEKISILPILLNTSIKLMKKNDADFYDVVYLPYLPLENVLTCMGTPMIFRDSIDNLLYDIEHGIENGIPTIVFIDCYNEPIRKDTYGKIHNDHCLLVCGIDKQYVTVLEQSNISTLNYHAQQLALTDLLDASKAYEQFYIQKGEKAKHRYFQLLMTQPDHKVYEELLSKYAASILDNSEENSRNLFSYIKKLKDFLLDNMEMDVNEVINTINETINTYKIRKYLYDELWPGAVLPIDDLLLEWTYLRMALFRKSENICNDKYSLCKVFDKVVYAEKVLQDNLVSIAKNRLRRI